MRDPKRIDRVLKVLGDNWKKVPDWRLMQLMCNLQRACGDDMFYIEDDEFIRLVEEFFAEEKTESHLKSDVE